MLFFVKSKCITVIAQNTWMIRRRWIYEATSCLKTWGCTIFTGKSLAAGSPSFRSNVNRKLQARPYDRGHVTFSGLQFPHQKPDAKGLFRRNHYHLLSWLAELYCRWSYVINIYAHCILGSPQAVNQVGWKSARLNFSSVKTYAALLRFSRLNWLPFGVWGCGNACIRLKCITFDAWRKFNS